MSAAPTTERATKKQWAGLILLVLPMLMVASDLTVLFLALPSLSADLEPSASQGLWITHIYGFVIASLLVTAGRLGDRAGPRRVLLIGAAAFGVLSAVAAFSVNAEMLIIARALLGAAGATLMPSLFSLLRTMFADESQRRLAIAIMLSALTVGGAIGPVMGGALLEFFWWGAVFLINVPFVVLLMLLGPWLLPERAERNSARLDLPSVALSVAGILALVYGLQELAAGQETGEGSILPNLAVAAAGVLLLGLFVRRQQRLASPLFDLDLLRNPRIGASLCAMLLVAVGVLGMFFLLTQYMQLVVGLTPLQAGLWTLPFAATNIVGAMLAPQLAKRLRPAVVVALGLGVVLAGAVLMAVTVGPDTPLPIVIAAMSVLGFGQGLAFALVTDLIVSSAPTEKTGSVSAAQEVSGELGHALGIAAGGAVGTVVYRAWLESVMPAEVPESAADTALSSLHGGVAAAEGLGSGGPALLDPVHDAIVLGLQTYAVIGGVLIGLATLLVTVVLVIRDRGRHHDRDADREPDSAQHEQDALSGHEET
ncbi:MFS transporter [Nocardiopsis nanhaiensis]